jgi:hypothetical protein
VRAPIGTGGKEKGGPKAAFVGVSQVVLCRRTPADEKRDNKKDKEEEEQDLGDFRRHPGNPHESKQSRNQRNNQKDDGVVKHDDLLSQFRVSLSREK